MASIKRCPVRDTSDAGEPIGSRRHNMQTTFPQLLLDHAQRRPGAPAMREKEYGIWQTTTWADMAPVCAAVNTWW